MKPPIVCEEGQPDDFADVLDSIEFLLKQSGMSWGHERVMALVNNLHAAAGYIPANYQCAGLALSYQQLKAIEKRLQLHLGKTHETYSQMGWREAPTIEQDIAINSTTFAVL